MKNFANVLLFVVLTWVILAFTGLVAKVYWLAVLAGWRLL